jgi:hypothetical protein
MQSNCRSAVCRQPTARSTPKQLSINHLNPPTARSNPKQLSIDDLTPPKARSTPKRLSIDHHQPPNSSIDHPQPRSSPTASPPPVRPAAPVGKQQAACRLPADCRSAADRPTMHRPIDADRRQVDSLQAVFECHRKADRQPADIQSGFLTCVRFHSSSSDPAAW